RRGRDDEPSIRAEVRALQDIGVSHEDPELFPRTSLPELGLITVGSRENVRAVRTKPRGPNTAFRQRQLDQLVARFSLANTPGTAHCPSAVRTERATQRTARKGDPRAHFDIQDSRDKLSVRQSNHFMAVWTDRDSLFSYVFVQSDRGALASICDVPDS